jgi:hypothetical protein
MANHKTKIDQLCPECRANELANEFYHQLQDKILEDKRELNKYMDAVVFALLMSIFANIAISFVFYVFNNGTNKVLYIVGWLGIYGLFATSYWYIYRRKNILNANLIANKGLLKEIFPQALKEGLVVQPADGFIHKRKMK